MSLKRFAFASSSARQHWDDPFTDAICAFQQPTPGGLAFKPLWSGFHSKSQLQNTMWKAGGSPQGPVGTPVKTSQGSQPAKVAQQEMWKAWPS